MSSIHIAVEGCCHGELDAIYSTITHIQQEKGVPVELLLVCGDFECIRDTVDLECVAVPPKYRKLTGFDDYVAGRKMAPVLTIFVGGNHEASNVLHELYYGGWVAPNIYFLGFAGVVSYKGIRIGGISGIYNERHYRMGHFERPPFSEDSIRSVYHVRELEVYRLAHLAQPHSAAAKKVDIFLSHDWPADVWNHGDCQALLRKKKHLADDVRSGRLGSPPLRALLGALQPAFWFAAHLHVKFSALVPHYGQQSFGSIDTNVQYTKFLALDKVLPGRDFLQVLSVPCNDPGSTATLQYDPEWLAVVKKTHLLLSTAKSRVSVPASVNPPTAEEEEEARELVIKASPNSSLEIPLVAAMDSGTWGTGNAQTDSLLQALDLEHIWTRPFIPGQPTASRSDLVPDVEQEPLALRSSAHDGVHHGADASIEFAELLQLKRDDFEKQPNVATVCDSEATAPSNSEDSAIPRRSFLSLPEPKFG